MRTHPPFPGRCTGAVKHRHVTIAGVDIFYREAGPPDAPVLLLPHGYPCSSYEFRALMPLLADRWHLLAPDFPGCGYSGTPDGFRYDFDGYADFLERFIEHQRIGRFGLYLHDFGSQIGLRLAIRHPERITGLIIQNGDIYADALGPKYKPLMDAFKLPAPELRKKLAESITEHGFKDEFLNDVAPDVAELIPPDLWELHWSLMSPRRREIEVDVIAGLKENLGWFPRYQEYLRNHHPPTLIAWGPRDGYMPESSARAYLRDLPNARLHLFADGGHWLLETHLAEVAVLIRSFLDELTPEVHRSERQSAAVSQLSSG
jgi:pimeloyl-ACP methyl ester carboxylesterase